MKRSALIALWLALLGQVLWMLGTAIVARAPGEKALYDGALVAAFAALAATGGRARRLAAALRMLVGLVLLGSVADRCGLFGPPEAPGVSWGDFAHFVAYTRVVNAFLPASWAPALAALATTGETGLGFALLVGLRPALAARGAAVLLTLFGVAMTRSLGPAAPLPYAVWTLAAGAWTLGTVDASAFSVDRWLIRRRAPGLGLRWLCGHPDTGDDDSRKGVHDGTDALALPTRLPGRGGRARPDERQGHPPIGR